MLRPIIGARRGVATMAVAALTSRLSDPSLFQQRGFIDGEWVDADSGATFDVKDPATDAVIGTASVVAACPA